MTMKRDIHTYNSLDELHQSIKQNRRSVLLFNGRFLVIRMALPVLVVINELTSWSLAWKHLYLIIVAINAGMSLIKFQTREFVLVQEWTLDMCLVLVGINLVTENDLFS